jgi:NTE family protein
MALDPAGTGLGAGPRAATNAEPAAVAGYVDFAPWGGRVFLAGGALEVGADHLTYRARVRFHGGWLPLEATRRLVDDPGLDAWSDATTLDLVVGDLHCTLNLGVRGLASLLSSVEPVGAHGLADHAEAVRALAARGLRGALRAYL